MSTTSRRANSIPMVQAWALALILVAALLSSGLVGTPAVQAQEVAMYGNTPSRNMVSDETGLPTEFDPASGKNILWTARVGSQSYAGPVVAGGKVYVGTNNEAEKNPQLTGDRGVIMAFDLENGALLWQSTHTKLPDGRVHDWPLQGICSTPYIEGDRLYYVSNRAELVCADTEGLHDGENDGPIKDENDKSENGPDLIWSLDLIGELDVFPHNLAAGSPLIVGDLVYAVTGNGVDEGHVNVPSPFGPSLVAVHKDTGKLVWDNTMPGENILHGSWSNPSYGVIGGTPMLIYPGGDGWLYSLDPKTGDLIWKFDCNPKDSQWRLGGAGTRNNIISTPVIHKDRVYIAVGQDPEHGEGPGHLWVVDGKQRGDVTDKAVIWHRGGEDFHRTISTVAIKDDIAYAADLSGFLYALNADTGEHYWTYDAFAAVWGSPFVADGKVYLGDEDGDLVVLEHSKTKKVLAEINLGSAVYTTPVAQDGVLYILSRTQLFALKEGAMLKPSDG